jgi:hypothetical protein
VPKVRVKAHASDFSVQVHVSSGSAPKPGAVATRSRRSIRTRRWAQSTPSSPSTAGTSWCRRAR